MLYYEYRGYTLCSCEELPYRHLAALPQEGEVLYLFERPLMIGRDTFPVTDAALLTAEEGVQTLCAGETPDVPPELADAIADKCGGTAAVFSGSDGGGYAYCLIARQGDLRQLGRDMTAALHGRGGGKPLCQQGRVQAAKGEIEAFFADRQ